MNAGPRRAMVLAAGRGERLRPLTDDTPKPLLEVGGKTLIDRALDSLAGAGVDVAIVNLWYRAESIERHLADRDRPCVAFSREDTLMDTGGGVAKALGRLGRRPFYAVNSDVVWFDSVEGALPRLAAAWDDDAMDALLLLVPAPRAVGYHGMGDFYLGPTGAVRRRGEREVAPFVFAGVQILHPRLFRGCPDGAFSLNLLYDRAIADGRLFGIVHDSEWLHIGTVQGLARAERRLGGTAWD